MTADSVAEVVDGNGSGGSPGTVESARAGDRVAVTPPSLRYADWKVASAGWDAHPPLTALTVAAGDDVLVLVAHPDDETFGIGGSLADLVEHGVDVHVVAMTAGERALAHLGRHPPDLGDRRRRELYAACAALRVSTTQVIGLADGGLAAAETEVIGTVEDLLLRHRPAHVLTTWWDDPHADHAALGAITREAAVRAGIPVSGFPVWAMHWSDPHVMSRENQVTVLNTSARARGRRQAAVACYPSQTQPLDDDLEPVLPADVVAAGLEIVVRG